MEPPLPVSLRHGTQTKLRLEIEGPGNGTVQNAANSYAKTKFSHSKGALAFYNELQCHASRMVQPPDEYSMKRKFLKGLLEDLVENLLKSRRVSAEHTTLTTLLCEVKAMESSLQAFQNYKSDRAERPTTSRNTSNSNSHNSSNNRTPRVVRLLRGNKGATLWVTPNILVTEGQLHEVVVMTLVTALAVVIIITAIKG